jgi:hypothetical protein
MSHWEVNFKYVSKGTKLLRTGVIGYDFKFAKSATFCSYDVIDLDPFHVSVIWGPCFIMPEVGRRCRIMKISHIVPCCNTTRANKRSSIKVKCVSIWVPNGDNGSPGGYFRNDTSAVLIRKEKNVVLRGVNRSKGLFSNFGYMIHSGFPRYIVASTKKKNINYRIKSTNSTLYAIYHA